MEFKTRLKRLRKAAGLSQAQLAERCDRSGQSWIGNFESGSQFPRFEDIPRLAAALGVHPGALFADLPQSQPAELDLDRLGIALTSVDKALSGVHVQGSMGTLATLVQFAYRHAFKVTDRSNKAQMLLLDELVSMRLGESEDGRRRAIEDRTREDRKTKAEIKKTGHG